MWLRVVSIVVVVDEVSTAFRVDLLQCLVVANHCLFFLDYCSCSTVCGRVCSSRFHLKFPELKTLVISVGIEVLKFRCPYDRRVCARVLALQVTHHLGGAR